MTLSTIINVQFQDGSRGWRMVVNDKAIKILAKTAKELIKSFPNNKTVETYSKEQSDTVKVYTTYTFES